MRTLTSPETSEGAGGFYRQGPSSAAPSEPFLHTVTEATPLPICSACVEGWLSRPEDGEPDRASVIFGDQFICGFHAQILWDDLPAIRIFGIQERGRRL